MTPPEFGRPKNLQASLERLPNCYERQVISVEPEERVVMLREFLGDFVEKSNRTNDIHFGFRYIPIEIEAMKLLYNLNSFRRSLDSEKTYQWSYLGEGSYPWPIVYSTGDNAYRWWQITDIDPEIKIGKYKLICVETNLEIKGSKNFRFDEVSDFLFVLASEDEIQYLHRDLELHHSLGSYSGT